MNLQINCSDKNVSNDQITEWITNKETGLPFSEDADFYDYDFVHPVHINLEVEDGKIQGSAVSNLCECSFEVEAKDAAEDLIASN